MHLILTLFLVVATAGALAQQYSTPSSAPVLPDTAQAPTSEAVSTNTATSVIPADPGLPDAPSHVMQPTSEAKPISSNQFTGSTRNPGAYPALVFSGATSDGKDSSDSHQAAGSSSGQGGNCGRSSSDKSGESGWFKPLLSMTSKSGHYCALGEGSFWKRGTYAMGRAFAAHRYDNAASFTNPAEFFALGLTPGTSASFNPYQAYAYRYDAGERLATRYATAVGRDTLKNMFREFWPDISSHVLKRRP